MCLNFDAATEVSSGGNLHLQATVTVTQRDSTWSGLMAGFDGLPGKEQACVTVVVTADFDAFATMATNGVQASSPY